MPSVRWEFDRWCWFSECRYCTQIQAPAASAAAAAGMLARPLPCPLTLSPSTSPRHVFLSSSASQCLWDWHLSFSSAIQTPSAMQSGLAYWFQNQRWYCNIPFLWNDTDMNILLFECYGCALQEHRVSVPVKFKDVLPHLEGLTAGFNFQKCF